jgi:DNA-binding NtrC family response regulator
MPVLLAVSSDPGDPEVLESNLKGWRVHRATTCHDALSKLRESACDVILCEESLSDGGWRDLLAHSETLNTAVPVVVMSHAADESMWAEVLRDGAFDLLAKPLAGEDISRVLSRARIRSAQARFMTVHA